MSECWKLFVFGSVSASHIHSQTAVQHPIHNTQPHTGKSCCQPATHSPSLSCSSRMPCCCCQHSSPSFPHTGCRRLALAATSDCRCQGCQAGRGQPVKPEVAELCSRPCTGRWRRCCSRRSPAHSPRGRSQWGIQQCPSTSACRWHRSRLRQPKGSAVITQDDLANPHISPA